ncbi:chemotaxis protein [Paenibacillus sp. 7541]|nr:chemotaxis protein [Paenibacillus sp. 7541]
MDFGGVRLRNKKWTKFSFKEWNRYGNKLILSFLVILLVPSSVIAFTTYTSVKGMIDTRLLDTAQNNVQMAEESIDQFMSAQMENIDFLSQAIAAGRIKDDHDPDIRQLLDRIQSSKEDVEQTYVGTSTGDFMNSPTTFQNPPDYDPRQRPWYQSAMENQGQIIITDPYISQSSGQVVVTVAKATADERGVVAVNLKLESLTELIGNIKIGEKGYIFLLDQNNHIISHPTVQAGEPLSGEFLEEINRSTSGGFNYKADGEELKYAFHTNGTTGWKIVASMAQSEVTNEVNPIMFTMGIVILVAIAGGGLLIVFMIRSMTKPIHALVQAAEKMSQGDLSHPIDLKRGDELGTLALAFNHMRKNLSHLTLQIRDKSLTLAASSEQLTASTEQNTLASEHVSASIQEMTAEIEGQAHRIEESSRMAGEMSASIGHISSSAAEASSTAARAVTVIQEGNEAIATTVEQMHDIKNTVSDLSESIQGLGRFSQEISQIVDVITDIAGQTNLLALNASIEAARAGEGGKGFAVVASEVRKLAEQSTRSAEQIRDMITTIQSVTTKAVDSMNAGTAEVDKGIEVVNHAGESFKNITGYVHSITDQINEITGKIADISAGTEQFVLTFQNVAEVADSTAGAAQTVSASTEEQLASLEEIKGSASSLTEMAEEMQQLVEQFKL